MACRGEWPQPTLGAVELRQCFRTWGESDAKNLASVFESIWKAVIIVFEAAAFFAAIDMSTSRKTSGVLCFFCVSTYNSPSGVSCHTSSSGPRSSQPWVQVNPRSNERTVIGLVV